MPNRAFLRASLALWRRRLAYRERKHRFYHRHSKRPVEERQALATKWHKLATEASAMVARRKRQLARTSSRPRIVTAKQAGLSPAGVFGGLGAETKVTTHYAASPRARNLTEGLRLARQFDAFHRSKGWGGISYHYLIPDTGELICGRSTHHKGAHVANMNAGNVGINFYSSTGDRPTEAQKRTYRWLLAHAHTSALPQAHRTDRDLRRADIRGHNAWPGNGGTGCPGYFTPSNLGG